jgi:hypothetical protein
MTAPTIDLPDTFVVDGVTHTTYVAKPCWVYAWTTTDEDGKTWLTVYRCIRIEDDSHRWLEPVADAIKAAELLKRETIVDENMMGGQAELSMYGLRSR